MKESKKILRKVETIITEIYQLKSDIGEIYFPETLPIESRYRREELETLANLFEQWARRCQA